MINYDREGCSFIEVFSKEKGSVLRQVIFLKLIEVDIVPSKRSLIQIFSHGSAVV
jgi:hypothetical protein